jgi:hypothetical protein
MLGAVEITPALVFYTSLQFKADNTRTHSCKLFLNFQAWTLHA